jgi:hypothetical protein
VEGAWEVERGHGGILQGPKILSLLPLTYYSDFAYVFTFEWRVPFTEGDLVLLNLGPNA